MDSKTEQTCVLDLRRIVRRLDSSGMNSEQIKVWFVENIPSAMRQAALLPRLSRQHNVPGATRHTSIEQEGE